MLVMSEGIKGHRGTPMNNKPMPSSIDLAVMPACMTGSAGQISYARKLLPALLRQARVESAWRDLCADQIAYDALWASVGKAGGNMAERNSIEAEWREAACFVRETIALLTGDAAFVLGTLEGNGPPARNRAHYAHLRFQTPIDTTEYARQCAVFDRPAAERSALIQMIDQVDMALQHGAFDEAAPLIARYQLLRKPAASR